MDESDEDAVGGLEGCLIGGGIGGGGGLREGLRVEGGSEWTEGAKGRAGGGKVRLAGSAFQPRPMPSAARKIETPHRPHTTNGSQKANSILLSPTCARATNHLTPS